MFPRFERRVLLIFSFTGRWVVFSSCSISDVLCFFLSARVVEHGLKCLDFSARQNKQNCTFFLNIYDLERLRESTYGAFLTTIFATLRLSLVLRLCNSELVTLPETSLFQKTKFSHFLTSPSVQ